MPLQNRVTPCGEIVAESGRGLLMGNRGILLDKNGLLGKSRWKTKSWISCVTKLGDRRVPLSDPKHYTPLFFLDEAVALAAGHRPCWRCRRDAHREFKAAWPPNGRVSTKEMDDTLHKERINPPPTGERRYASGGKRKHKAKFQGLPCGTFVVWRGQAWLVLDSSLIRYTSNGYDRQVRRPTGEAIVLTPRAAVAALTNGYAPILHGTAKAAFG